MGDLTTFTVILTYDNFVFEGYSLSCLRSFCAFRSVCSRCMSYSSCNSFAFIAFSIVSVSCSFLMRWFSLGAPRE